MQGKKRKKERTERKERIKECTYTRKMTGKKESKLKNQIKRGRKDSV